MTSERALSLRQGGCGYDAAGRIYGSRQGGRPLDPDRIKAALYGGGQDDGLLQRFQLLTWPDPSGTWRNVDRWPDTAAKAAAWSVFQGLDRLEPEALGAQRNPDGSGIPWLRFSPEAQEVFDAWRETLEVRLRGEREAPAFEGHLSKYRSPVPSLALLIHLAEGHAGPVGEAPTVAAVAWAEYLEGHARRLYSPALDPALTAAGSSTATCWPATLPSPSRRATCTGTAGGCWTARVQPTRSTTSKSWGAS